MNPWSSLRQLGYPREFRIAPAVWPSGLLSVLEKLAQTLRDQHRQAPDESPEAQRERVRFLADVGTGLWRLRQKMLQPGTERPLEEMRRAYRHLESTWDALAQAGVEIQEHTGAPYDPGMSLKVIAFQPTPGINREKILETIKPTIYLKNQPIQMGEVIVGTPEK
jgi:hypothetical protein